MKSISHARVSSSLLCLLLLATSQADTGAPASLRFVNATGATAPLSVRINGEHLQSRGYLSGEVTGRLELAAGPCQLELHHPSLGRVTLELALTPGDTRTVIALSQPASGEVAHQPAKLACQVLTPPTGPPVRHRLQVLQVTSQPELPLQLANHPLLCHRLQATTLDLAQPSPELKYAGQRLGRLPFEEAGDGTLVLYTDTDNRLRHVFFLTPASSSSEPVDRE
jgi:hypothetical protein